MAETSPICEQLMEFINANPVLSSYMTNKAYIPAPEVRLRAIKLVPQPRILIFGQDPYPRAESASGMAFNDLRVKQFFSKQMSPSLRNIYKALLDFNKIKYKGVDDFYNKLTRFMEGNGFRSVQRWFEQTSRVGVCWLNTALTFENKDKTAEHLKAWAPAIKKYIQLLNLN